MRATLAAAATLALAIGAAGCDRRIEPFVPGEEPEQPDLSRIFPAGADGAPPPAAADAAPAPPASPSPAPASAAQESIRGTVRLAEPLAERVPPGAVLFLIARAAEVGPPLAVLRVASPRFPMEFSIGPENRMLESMPFAGPLRLTARLDADGNATTRASGDMWGAAPGTHQPGDRGVVLVIDQVL